jgi:methionyl aminopeptidase
MSLDKKKKKKKKSKKKKAAVEKVLQSEPPRVGLSKIFPDGIYPVGETHEYKNEYVLFSFQVAAIR